VVVINENLQKIIMIGASVLMTIGIIGISMRLYSTAEIAVNESEKEIVRMNKNYKKSKFIAYDNLDCYGYEVITAMNLIDNEDVDVKVTTIAGEEKTYTKSSRYNVLEEVDSNYINPEGIFEADIEYNANNVVTALMFKQNA